jgi:hypothetical protein
VNAAISYIQQQIMLCLYPYQLSPAVRRQSRPVQDATQSRKLWIPSFRSRMFNERERKVSITPASVWTARRTTLNAVSCCPIMRRAYSSPSMAAFFNQRASAPLLGHSSTYSPSYTPPLHFPAQLLCRTRNTPEGNQEEFQAHRCTCMRAHSLHLPNRSSHTLNDGRRSNLGIVDLPQYRSR